MEDIFLPFKKGGMNDIDLGEPTASQPETSSQESSSTDINSASTQVGNVYVLSHLYNYMPPVLYCCCCCECIYYF